MTEKPNKNKAICNTQCAAEVVAVRRGTGADMITINLFLPQGAISAAGLHQRDLLHCSLKMAQTMADDRRKTVLRGTFTLQNAFADGQGAGG